MRFAFILTCLAVFGFTSNAYATTLTVTAPLDFEIHEVMVTPEKMVQKGDVLFSYKCSPVGEARVYTGKVVKALEQDYLKKLQLEDLGMESKKAVTLARSRYEKKQEKLGNLEKIAAQCVVKAPKAGQVKKILFNLPFKPLVDQPLMMLELQE